MRATMFKLAASWPAGYGTVDLYLRAIARILSELSCASSAVRCKKSSGPRSFFALPAIAPMEAPSLAERPASSLPPLSFNCRKKNSSALIRPLFGSDERKRNCSGREKVTPVGDLAANACGVSSPIATPSIGSVLAQQLSKYRPSHPSLSVRSASEAVCQISVDRKCDRFGFG